MEKLDDNTLERLAVTELLGEAKRGKERYSTMGVTGWLKPKVPPTNKRFLERTLQSTRITLKNSSKKEKTGPPEINPHRKTETDVTDGSYDKSHHCTGTSRSNDNKAFKRGKMCSRDKHRFASNDTLNLISHKGQKVVKDCREKVSDRNSRKELKSPSRSVDFVENRNRKRHRHRSEDRKYEKFHRSENKALRSPSPRAEDKYRKKK